MAEHTAVAEPGDGGDLITLEREHHQPVRTGDRRLGVGKVAAERGLAIGARGSEAERPTAQDGAIVEEPGDRCVALILEGLGRHREPGVVGEKGDDPVHISALHRVSEATDQLALAPGPWQRRALTVTGWKPGLERRPCALERTLHRSFARFEHVRGLRRSETEYVAQHQYRPLSRWQVLEGGHKRTVDSHLEL